MRERINVNLKPGLMNDLVDLSRRKKISRSALIEAAVSSYLSPDGMDRREAAFTRRLDRISRQIERLERDVGISAETLALFVRFWLSITPPLAPEAEASTHAKGKQRFEGFIETLGGRLQKGESFLREISFDIERRELQSDQ